MKRQLSSSLSLQSCLLSSFSFIFVSHSITYSHSIIYSACFIVLCPVIQLQITFHFFRYARTASTYHNFTTLYWLFHWPGDKKLFGIQHSSPHSMTQPSYKIPVQRCISTVSLSTCTRPLTTPLSLSSTSVSRTIITHCITKKK